MTESRPPVWLPEWAFKQLLPLREEVSIWLVGGALRDHFLGRDSYDYDFVVAGEARKAARNFANSLSADYYDLDSDRDTGRVLMIDEQDRRVVFDFSSCRGGSIIEDLGNRDFTVNSLAVDLYTPEDLIDPSDGLRDIRDRTLRSASPQSFSDDPIRVLRAVRFAILMQGRMDPETLNLLRAARGDIIHVSKERIRDEVFRILALARPSSAIRLMEHLDLIEFVFPELGEMSAVPTTVDQPDDLWHHTLSVLDHLESLIAVMSPDNDPELAAQLMLGEYSLRLGRFRDSLNQEMQRQLSVGRSLRQLLLFAAMYHDTGKVVVGTQVAEDEQQGRYPLQGAKIIGERAKELRLSTDEVRWLSRVVAGHTEPTGWSHTGGLSKRAIYRFVKDSGDAAPGVLLLSLADVLAQVPTVDQDMWGTHLETVASLLGAYFSSQTDAGRMGPLVRGDELSQMLGIDPGPLIGRILAELEEARAIGEIHSKEEAIELAQRIKETAESG